jgi:hypothetical protein
MVKGSQSDLYIQHTNIINAVPTTEKEVKFKKKLIHQKAKYNKKNDKTAKVIYKMLSESILKEVIKKD